MHIISPVLWQFLIKWLTNFAVFPPEASKIAADTDALYFFLVGISIIGMVAVCILVFGFSIRYRKDRHPEATQIEGSTLLEATWTIIPLALFMICFVWGALLYFRIYDPPANAMNIYVVGKQWMWKAEHPGGQHEINALHVPSGRPVQLTMISQDVFHSFSIPDFRVKREVIPGRYTTVWFQATDPGTYHHIEVPSPSIRKKTIPAMMYSAAWIKVSIANARNRLPIPASGSSRAICSGVSMFS